MEKVTSADGATIAIDRSGRGPALILVVGAFGDRSSTKSLAAGLAPNFSVYEYDRCGRGDSDDRASYAIKREVDDLAAVVDAAGGSAFVFGHSSGGALALEAAARHVPIHRLVVYEPPYTAGPTADFARQLADLVAAGHRADATERFLALMGTPPEALNQMKTGPYWAHLEALAHTLPYDITLCNSGVAPRDRLAKITAPTLALAGGASPAWAREVARVIATTIPNGQLRVLEGQGHGATDEALIPVLSEFFARPASVKGEQVR